MFSINRRLFSSITNTSSRHFRRFCSSAKDSKTAATEAPSINVAEVVAEKPRGSSFFQRLSSFIVGLSTGLALSYLVVYEEFKAHNHDFDKRLQELEAMIATKK